MGDESLAVFRLKFMMGGKCEFLQDCLLTVRGASVTRSSGTDIEPKRMSRTRRSAVATLVRKKLGIYAKKTLSEVSLSPKEQGKTNKCLLTDEDISFLTQLARLENVETLYNSSTVAEGQSYSGSVSGSC